MIIGGGTIGVAAALCNLTVMVMMCVSVTQRLQFDGIGIAIAIGTRSSSNGTYGRREIPRCILIGYLRLRPSNWRILPGISHPYSK